MVKNLTLMPAVGLSGVSQDLITPVCCIKINAHRQNDNGRPGSIKMIAPLRQPLCLKQAGGFASSGRPEFALSVGNFGIF